LDKTRPTLHVIVCAILCITCACAKDAKDAEVNKNQPTKNQPTKNQPTSSSAGALPVFNRDPLRANPYAQLPLGAVKPEGWLKDQLQRMADGMTGKLDQLYVQVVGPRNGWLGGVGDGWERGPYWIDGLLPLAYLLEDEKLLAKVRPWVEWTLTHQREDGYIGPAPFDTEPAKEFGLQRGRRRDWWPKMVMLKVLMQHYSATGDRRVIECLTNYFHFQQQELPKTPLGHWSFWANRRGGDNLMAIYWLYNITGDKFLLELGDLVYQQTFPFTPIFLEREKIRRTVSDSPGQNDSFHCVNLAQGIKTPIIRYQADSDPKHLQAVDIAFEDLEKLYGQPHGLFGADEETHGPELTRGSELCTAVELMFSLEKMLEITGNLAFADRLEMVAFNSLPAQISDDFMLRQYFQQANQVMCTLDERDFFDNSGDGLVFGLLSGYPCCTCNMHQAWPKFTQHLWMASADKGLAALVYAPSRVQATVADGRTVTITEKTNYPFEESITFTIKTATAVQFPLHLRVPQWCRAPSLTINGNKVEVAAKDNLVVLNRSWQDGDTVSLQLPAQLRVKRWHRNTASIYRGPLLYAMPIKGEWSKRKMCRWSKKEDIREVRPTEPWNYALAEEDLGKLEERFRVVRTPLETAYPWTAENAPIRLETRGVKLPQWGLENGNMAATPPKSPSPFPENVESKPITLIPYGCTTLRISGFPTVQ
jgi:hypothetical protein